MSSRTSAGLLLYRHREQLEVLLVHPGGPFWKKKDAGAWSIPKGELQPDEDPLEAAKREFAEETGFEIDGIFTALRPVRQAGGKIVQAWMVEGDCDASAIKSNLVSVEWPPRSGRTLEIPEVDRAEWFTLEEARSRINAAQAAFLDQLESMMAQE
jgi:predicted NUDIX family NTP pyrophosphohydrolase